MLKFVLDAMKKVLAGCRKMCSRKQLPRNSGEKKTGGRRSCRDDDEGEGKLEEEQGDEEQEGEDSEDEG